MADNGGSVQDNADGTWTIMPAPNYSGPVELTYTVLDGQGGQIAASQLFVVAAVAAPHVNSSPTGSVTIAGTAGRARRLRRPTPSPTWTAWAPSATSGWPPAWPSPARRTATLVLGPGAGGQAISVQAAYTDGSERPRA